VVHGFFDSDTIIEVDGHIGHGAVLHGCRIARNAMVGMNAVVMDDAVIGESSIVAASAFVKSGFLVPPRSLVVGTPARVIRELTEEEIAWKARGTLQYHNLTVRSLRSMQETAPLTEVEADRKRIRDQSAGPPHKRKGR
jgi:phenylacetic acid degradation protein